MTLYLMWQNVQRLLAVIILVIISPLLAIISLIILLREGWPVFYLQDRAGKEMRPFKMIKFRTMRKGAENEQRELCHQNEADGPVFKIRNDPRYTKFGRRLSHLGLDELPQLVNVMRSEMSFVGPRPLPLAEAKKVPRIYFRRYEILPGLTSSWVVNGAHNLSFKEWMEFDLEDVDERGVRRDLIIMGKTVLMLGKWLLQRGGSED